MKAPRPEQSIMTAFEEMANRFKERANAIEKSGMPPLEGENRRNYIKQKELDYRDFLMIADCDIALKDGILTMTLDLRPEICDATLRGPKAIKRGIGLSGYNPNFEYGGEG